MSPEPEPYPRESEAVDTSHNHLRRRVIPQKDPRVGNRACPQDNHERNEGAKEWTFRKRYVPRQPYTCEWNVGPIKSDGCGMCAGHPGRSRN